MKFYFNYCNETKQNKENCILNAKEFIKTNIDKIKSFYHSSNMCWYPYLEINKPVITYITFALEECLVISNKHKNSKDNLIVGYKLAYKENNVWTLMELYQHSSKHFCNHCQVPIDINDYSCLECGEYDICNSCFKTGVLSSEHNLTHVYIGTLGIDTSEYNNCIGMFDFMKICN